MPLQVQTQFNNVPGNAQNAFNAAVNVWAAQLDSNVPINIQVFYGTPLGGNLIGLCIPNAVQNAQYLQANTWYPTALANKLAGLRLQPQGQPDMEIHFAAANWNFNVNAAPQQGQIDFMTTALHEMCHGLGFVTLFAENPFNGLGSYGDSGLIANLLNFAAPNSPQTFPLPVFNSQPCLCCAQMKNGAGQVLTNTANFANPSLNLLTELTSNNIYFEGQNNRHYKFYAPGNFLFGTSMMHFDPASLPNSLMCPAVGAGQIHVPDAETLNVLHDLGW